MKEKLLSKINPKVVVPIAVGAVLAVVGIIALAVSLLGRGGSVTQAQAVELALAPRGGGAAGRRLPLRQGGRRGRPGGLRGGVLRRGHRVPLRRGPQGRGDRQLQL